MRYNALPAGFLRGQRPQARIFFRGLAAAGRLWHHPQRGGLQQSRTSPGEGWVRVTVGGQRAERAYDGSRR